MNNLKLISNIEIKRPRTPKPAPHAFITFINEVDADNAIKEKNGSKFKDKTLRVELKKEKNTSPTKVFVGNLPLDVSKEDIEKLFNGITSVKILGTQKPTSYAFITFIKEVDADNAIEEKNGCVFKEDPLRVEHKNNSSPTKVYVGNLPLDVSKEDIEKLFNGITGGKEHREAAHKYIVFIKSGLHVNKGKAMNRNKTIIVYAIGNIFNKCIVRVEESDSSGMHAEEKMIDYLKYVEKIKKVYVYLSNSPCHNCAERLAEYSKKRGIEFDIHFVGLYRCYRKSCTNEECCNFEDSNNEDAVRNLNSNDQFKMSTFAPDTWDTLRCLISTYYKKQMQVTALEDSVRFQIRYLFMVNDIFKQHPIEREKEDQHMESDFDHLLKTTSENQREGKAKHGRTSDNEDQEGQSGSGNGGGSSKEETAKREDQDDDADKKVNEKQQIPEDQERHSNYQINDNPSSGYESDSTFDSSIWDMLNAYEESKEFQDINKYFTMKHNKYTTNKTQDTHATDDESDSAFDSWIWDKINACEDSKEFKNIEKNFTEQKCIVKPNSVSSKKQKKHGVTKKTEQFRSHAQQKSSYNRGIKMRQTRSAQSLKNVKPNLHQDISNDNRGFKVVK